jgi:acyl-CoA synthetase (AMP-forming)/AMP-acid ligase II
MPGEYPQCTVVEWVRRSAQEHPEREAIVCNERRVSWRGFDRRVNQVANTLISRGIRRGDRVAILASASIEYVEVFMGCLRAGACLVPLSTMASTDALEKMVRDCSAKAFFLSNSMRELVWPFIHNLPELDETNRFAFDFTDPQWHDYQSVTDAASADDPLIAVDFTDLFNIIYSSGTTGVPKGITHNHMMRAVQMERVEQNGYADNARTLLSTPLYSNTTIVALLPTLVGAGTVVLMPKFDARGYLQLVQQEQCTHSMLVPVQYKRIMQIEDFDTFDLSSMRLKFSTSAPLRADIKQDVLKRFPGGLVEYYGLTEGGGTTVLAAHEYPQKLHTVGQPAPGVKIKFIDEQGTEVPPQQGGEICGRSPAMMNGYFGRHDLTEETLWRDSNGDTYFRSGDMGHMDEDGFLHLSDRKKDMIISGGLNIYANDLELALLEDPDIEDVAVIGVPSEQWGETPLGLVVLKKNCTRSLDAILTEANSRLGKSQRLSKLESREELPRSSIGKILKRELRGPYWEGA